MATRMCQRVSRPLVNLFVARDRQGDRTEKDSVTVSFIPLISSPFFAGSIGKYFRIKSLYKTKSSVKRNLSFGYLTMDLT